MCKTIILTKTFCCQVIKMISLKVIFTDIAFNYNGSKFNTTKKIKDIMSVEDNLFLVAIKTR